MSINLTANTSVTEDRILNGSAATDTSLYTRTGNDTIRTNGGNDGVWSGDGNDRINAASGSHAGDVVTVHAGANNDFVFGGAGDDNLYGEDGNDILVGGGGSDRVNGGKGDDKINGGAGDDMLTGDDAVGDKGKDIFQFKIMNGMTHIDFGATLGNDVITDFRAGEDKIDMGSIFARMDDAGVDQFLQTIESAGLASKGYRAYEGSVDSVLATGSSGTLNGETIEYAVTSSWKTGNAKTFTIQFHTAGDDSDDSWSSLTVNNLASLKASDFIRETTKIAHGSDGNGVHGVGNDVLDFSTAQAQTDLGNKGVRAYGYGGNDTITGTDNKDVLIGGNGNDVLRGGAGTDELDGGNGNDVLFGDAGTDYLYGANGNNSLTGGSQKDYFVFAGLVDNWGGFHLDTSQTTVEDFAYGQDFIKFANLGDGYNGSLSGARLEQRFDVERHLTQEGNDLVIYGDDSHSRYVLKNLFDGSTHRDGHALSLDYVQHHVSDFVVWA